MLNRKFAHRVAVHQGAAVFYKSAGSAAHLLDAGLATVKRKAAKAIVEIELTNAAIGYQQGQVRLERLGLRPGSYGIQVEQLDGGRCYAHRYAWGELAGV